MIINFQNNIKIEEDENVQAILNTPLDQIFNKKHVMPAEGSTLSEYMTEVTKRLVPE